MARKYTKLKPTSFESKWGVTSQELAKSEGITTDALHMRVRNYGTPYQRAAKPDKFERRYGKTQYEIAVERGLSFTTIMFYENEKGGAYWAEDNPNFQNRKRNLYCRGRNTRRRNQFWLHPDHPRYADARACKWLGDSDE